MIPCCYYCWICFLRRARYTVLPSAWHIMYLPLCFHNWLSLIFISSIFLTNSVNAPWSMLSTQACVVFFFFFNSDCIHMYFKSQSGNTGKLFLWVIFFVKAFVTPLHAHVLTWFSLHSVLFFFTSAAFIFPWCKSWKQSVF